MPTQYVNGPAPEINEETAAKEIAAAARPRKTSGMTPAEKAALDACKTALKNAMVVLNGFRTGNPLTRSEVRALAASAGKGMPARMAAKIEKGVIELAGCMKDGYRNDQRLLEIALDAAGTAPQEFVRPEFNGDREDEPVEDVIARIPRGDA